jgi:superfamily II DNA or RNA helicase
MSIEINTRDLTEEVRAKIEKELSIKVTAKYTDKFKEIEPYRVNNGKVSIPYAYAFNNLRLKDNRPKGLPMTVECIGKLRPEQEDVANEAIDVLNKRGSVMISVFTGGGKTFTSLYLSCVIGLKTLIIVNKIVLMNQWKESIAKFIPSARVKLLNVKTKSINIDDIDFCIVNAQNLEKIPELEGIGVVICDESHLIMAEKLSQSLLCVHPRFLIGLTATPYRSDGLNILLDLFFGVTKIIRKLHRKHTVYKIDTKFTPTVDYMFNGRINWNVILESQANSESRNDLILDIISLFKERKFMVLVKRISQGEHLINKLIEKGEDVTSLLGDQQVYNTSSRILIGTCSKIGTGFDHPHLDALLLASDIEEYFIQYLGRVFRRKDVEPIIFDLVDNNALLIKHFNTRKKVYIEHGGTVKNLSVGNKKNVDDNSKPEKVKRLISKR